MFLKYNLLACVLVLFVGCKKNGEEGVNNTTNANKLTAKDISKIKYTNYSIDKNVQTAIAPWNDFNQLLNLEKQLKNADLSYFSNPKEHTNTLLNELIISIPSAVNTPAIIARITALSTKLYKLESLIKLGNATKEEQLHAIKEYFIAISSLKLQMNKKFEGDHNEISRP